MTVVVHRVEILVYLSVSLLFECVVSNGGGYGGGYGTVIRGSGGYGGVAVQPQAAPALCCCNRPTAAATTLAPARFAGGDAESFDEDAARMRGTKKPKKRGGSRRQKSKARAAPKRKPSDPIFSW